MIALRRGLTVWTVLQWLVLTLGSVLTIVPVVVTLYSSFKNNTDFFYSTWALPKVWHFENYVTAWTDGSMGRYFINSIIITFGGVAVNLLGSTPLSYALARYRFRFNGAIYLFVVAGLIAPGQLVGISLLQWIKTLGLFN